jgi:serine/threonine protein kinase
LFVDERGRIKIGEFGLANLCQTIAPLVPSITFTGFSRWRSPELLDIDPDEDSIIVPTKASDIWSLGCTVYEVS